MRLQHHLQIRSCTSRPATKKFKVVDRQDRKAVRAKSELALLAVNPDASLAELKAVGDEALRSHS